MRGRLYVDGKHFYSIRGSPRLIMILLCYCRLDGYFKTWPGTSARTPTGAALSDIPGLYGGVAYGLHHLAPFLLDNKTQGVQPSLDGSNPPNTNADTVKSQSDQSDSNGSENALETDTLPTHQFGPSLLDPAGCKTMAAIVERTVGWLRESGVGSEELLGACLFLPWLLPFEYLVRFVCS